MLKDLEHSLHRAKVELEGQNAENLAAKDREIAALKKELSKMKKDAREILAAGDVFKAKYGL